MNTRAGADVCRAALVCLERAAQRAEAVGGRRGRQRMRFKSTGIESPAGAGAMLNRLAHPARPSLGFWRSRPLS